MNLTNTWKQASEANEKIEQQAEEIAKLKELVKSEFMDTQKTVASNYGLESVDYDMLWSASETKRKLNKLSE